MATIEVRPTIFLKDFTEQGGDRFYWLVDQELVEIAVTDLVEHTGALLFHDFWLIRDVIFDATQRLPPVIVDLDEFRISTSGDPEDRVEREKCDIADELSKHGADPAICSAYRRIFYRGAEFDHGVASSIALAMADMYAQLCERAEAHGEADRFFSIEVPVYHVFQRAMSEGIGVNAALLSDMRRNAEHEYFVCLKEYSSKQDMPLEYPTDHRVEARLVADGFDLTGVSVEYMLEFVPHDRDLGVDTLALRRLGAARRVLSSMTLSSDRVRPIIDVFGSRTSRIQVRNPPLQIIPKKYRKLIVPDRGKMLSYVDYDQYEVGIMAALSGDPELSRLYQAGDMYDLFSAEHLGLEGNRKAAKQLFLSYAYGMSRRALIDAAVALGASREHAKGAFRMFSGYEEWKKSLFEAFLRDGSIATVAGNRFRRRSSGPLTAKERRSVVSQVVQGTASLIFKKAILEIDKLEDVRIVLPMHDALLFEHSSKGAPAQVVEAFESVMSGHFESKIVGKASVSEF